MKTYANGSQDDHMDGVKPESDFKIIQSSSFDLHGHWPHPKGHGPVYWETKIHLPAEDLGILL